MFKKIILLVLFFLTLPSVVHADDLNEESYAGAKSGGYDYLVYAVSWQPTFCLLYPDNPGCKNHPTGFYTHGIWPYFKSSMQSQNRHPSYCTHSPGCTNNSACALNNDTYLTLIKNKAFSRIVSSQPKELMMHEWKKHGTCYGKNQTEYFSDFYTLRNVVIYNNIFNQYINKTVDFAQLKTGFPKNTSFRCAEKNGKHYLFEVFYLINQQGQPYYDDPGLQIGGKCSASDIIIPG